MGACPGGVDKEFGVQILCKLYAVVCFPLLFGFIQCCRGQPWPSGSREDLPKFVLTAIGRGPSMCLAV